MKLSSCFAADFETTTDENDCRVWAYAVCNVDDYTDFRYGNSIEEFFDFCSNPVSNYKVWFHNLKFDGVYIIDYLLNNGYEWIQDRKDKGQGCAERKRTYGEADEVSRRDSEVAQHGL